jgi:hypothetical protein
VLVFSYGLLWVKIFIGFGGMLFGRELFWELPFLMSSVLKKETAQSPEVPDFDETESI